MSRKFRLISNPDGIWFEGDEDGDQTPMEIGRIICEDEILNGKMFSYWYDGQEKYFEEVPNIEENKIIEEFFEAHVTTEINRTIDIEMDFYDVMDDSFRNWPEDVKNIIRKRGGIDRLRIKDLVNIEQILGYKFIKISKL